MALALLIEEIKGPKKTLALQKAMLKLFRVLLDNFEDYQSFQAELIKRGWTEG